MAGHAVARQRLGEAAQEAREALALRLRLGDRVREREAPLEERVGDRVDQRLARREVPVDRADSDAGAAGDLVHAERRAALRVGGARRLEHALAVAHGVGAEPGHARRSPIARPASAGPNRLASSAMASNSCASRSCVGALRFARDGTNTAATPAPARATPITTNATT